MQNQNI